MKNAIRTYPLFSLCGLNCGLCPIHQMESGCPGCGGGAGNQPCAVARCGAAHEVEYCFQCREYPCSRYAGPPEFDSFLPTRNQLRDLAKAQEMGLERYRADLDEKVSILQELLDGYNDGRRKTFFCTAVNLLDLPDIRAVMAHLADGGPAEGTVKERALLAVWLFQEAADRRGISLRLKRKPRKK